jgi:hypothetical protein
MFWTGIISKRAIHEELPLSFLLQLLEKIKVDFFSFSVSFTQNITIQLFRFSTVTTGINVEALWEKI